MGDNNILDIKYCVVRDYTEKTPVLGKISCADFWKEEDAREYYQWQKRRWNTTEKKNPGQTFKWKLYKRTEYYPGTHPSGFTWELLLGE